MREDLPNAYEELMAYLEEGETVEGIVFGQWGWGSGTGKLGYKEEEPFIPFNLRSKVLTIQVAEPYMKAWSFYGGYGAPMCYATNIWTNKRVIWVTEYDGSTCLNSATRNPTDYEPDMPGS